MSKNKKVLIGVIALFLMLSVTVGIVVLLLHGRNTTEEESSVLETTVYYEPASVEVEVSTVAFEDKFGDNLSDNVGRVIVSTWLSGNDVNRALNALSVVFGSETDDIALYVRSIDIDKEEFVENVVYSVYRNGMVEQGVVEVSEDTSEAWSRVFRNVVYEEYRDQFNVYK